eukprot:2760013-Amphidinium_carterae.1
MVCIPKTIDNALTPEQTRPLLLANTMGKTLCILLLNWLHPILNLHVHPCQKGVLAGRSLEMNISELERIALNLALTMGQSAVFFLDLHSAFPSISHEYIWQMMRAAGSPEWFVRAIQNLYSQQRVHIKYSNCFACPFFFALVSVKVSVE